MSYNAMKRRPTQAGTDSLSSKLSVTNRPCGLALFLSVLLVIAGTSFRINKSNKHSVSTFAHAFDVGQFLFAGLRPGDNGHDLDPSTRYELLEPEQDKNINIELSNAATGAASANDNGGNLDEQEELSLLGSWSEPGSAPTASAAQFELAPPMGSVEVSLLNQQLYSPRPKKVGKEIYLLEDKDYPRSLFEDYQLQVSQVSGITTMANNDVVIFHRSYREWKKDTFNQTNSQIAEAEQENLIKNDTILIIDGETGTSVSSFGSNLFYMPHSVASDHLGNIWVSDVARHQIMRLPATNIRSVSNQANVSNIKTRLNAESKLLPVQHQVWPDMILGEAFVAGSDNDHFCQPSELVVSPDGQLVFVADGYCNKRIMVFSGVSGKLLKSFGERDNMQVVHSVTLIEEKNLLCVADRENSRILCYLAGLDGNLNRMGELQIKLIYPVGRVFAISSISSDHLLVSSNQWGSNRYDLAILNPFTKELKVVWTSSDLLEPHSLTTTLDRQYAYAADISKEAYQKVFRFDIIQHEN